jgi:aspartate aminotransferase
MKAAGIDVISMSLGEPDFDTPESVRRAAQEAIDNHWSHYGPVPGLPSLREAVAKSQNRLSAISYTADDVLVSVGAKMAIFNAIQAAINPGDEVIVPTPSWVSYGEMVKLAEGVAVPVETSFDNNYCLTPQELRNALTDKTRMLILCSPNNPTGSVYDRAQLEALVAVLRDYPEVIVLSDEIYNILSYEAPAVSFSAFPELADRLVVINGVSKAYAMTGYRVGWLLAKDNAFVKACTRLQGQQLTCATVVAQKAAEAALNGPQDCVQEMCAAFAERRELICRLAAEVPGFRFKEPKGAFYLFPDVSAIGSGDEVAALLLDRAHVAVVSGSAFGCPSCIRLSYAISTEEIKEAMRRIKEVIASL